MKTMDLVFAIIFTISVFACLFTITSRLKEEIDKAKAAILEMKKDSDANKEDLKTAFHMMRHRIDTLEKNQKINSDDIQKVVNSINDSFSNLVETEKPQTKKKSKKKDISKEN